jgi:two-component system chemotaxis response regulator CheB
MAYDIVVIGASLGGLTAIQMILTGLPKEFRLPVVIAQHRHKQSDGTLADLLAKKSALPVVEAMDKQDIAPATVYLAPADYHLMVETGTFGLSTEGPVNYSRPSIDVLFETAADAYGSGVIGVVLTGANSDGAAGAARIKESGGAVIVQDPATAEARTMPEAAIQSTRVDRILPLDQIAPYVVSCVKSGRAR